jgi:hypothetical protein
MTDGRISVLALGALGAEAPSFRVRTRVPSAELARYGVAMRHLPLFSVSDDRHFHAAGTVEHLNVLYVARSRVRRRLAVGVRPRCKAEAGSLLSPVREPVYSKH